jgi:hypothetical protein
MASVRLRSQRILIPPQAALRWFARALNRPAHSPPQQLRSPRATQRQGAAASARRSQTAQPSACRGWGRKVVQHVLMPSETPARIHHTFAVQTRRQRLGCAPGVRSPCRAPSRIHTPLKPGSPNWSAHSSGQMFDVVL